MGARLRYTYLSICAATGANLLKLSSKLDAKVAKRASHRQRQLDIRSARQRQKMEAQRQREIGRLRSELRNQRRLERRNARCLKRRVAREEAALRALKRLIARWSPRCARMGKARQTALKV